MKSKASQTRSGEVRILHVIRRLDVSRGAERIVAELVRTQPNHEVLVFDGGDSFYELNTDRQWIAKGFWRALLFCIENRKKYGLFHLHLVPATYLSLFLGPQAIIHIHSSSFPTWHNPLKRFAAWLSHRSSGANIAASKAAVKGLEDRLGAVPRMHILNNFVADIEFKPIAVKGKDKAKTELLMVASLERPKRQDIVIGSLVHLPDSYKLTLVGHGSQEQHLRSISESLGVAHRVTFSGAIADVGKMFAMADLCILISDWEGYGLVVVEAAKFGLPTVVNDVEGLRDSCPDRRLIAPGVTPEEIAAKVIEADEILGESILSLRLDEHWKKHSLELYIPELNAIYQSCL